MDLREALGRGLMLIGLVVTGMALLVGLFGGRNPWLLERLGGPIRAELAILACGAGLFFLGHVLGGRRK